VKKLEEMDLRIKTKLTNIKNLNPETCYDEISDSDSDEICSVSEKSKLNNNSKLQLIEEEKQRERRNKANQLIIETYKSWVKIFDLLVTILAFTSCILAQIENEDYYLSNKDKRTLQINLINFMRFNEITNKNTTSQLLNNSNYISFNNTFNISTEYILSFSNFESVEIDLKVTTFGNYLRYIILVMSLSSSNNIFM
jgi:hypothetical protein